MHFDDCSFLQQCADSSCAIEGCALRPRVVETTLDHFEAVAAFLLRHLGKTRNANVQVLRVMPGTMSSAVPGRARCGAVWIRLLAALAAMLSCARRRTNGSKSMHMNEASGSIRRRGCCAISAPARLRSSARRSGAIGWCQTQQLRAQRVTAATDGIMQNMTRVLRFHDRQHCELLAKQPILHSRAATTAHESRPRIHGGAKWFAGRRAGRKRHRFSVRFRLSLD